MIDRLMNGSLPMPLTPLGRRARMVRFILEHPELDETATKGELIFHCGRTQGGDVAVSVQFLPSAAPLH